MPDRLLADIEDTTFTVRSWSAEVGELILRVWKDNPEEAGEATFRGVSWLCLPRRITVREVVSGGIELLPNSFRNAAPAPGEWVVAFIPTWGQPSFVVCESLMYESHAEQAAAPHGGCTSVFRDV